MSTKFTHLFTGTNGDPWPDFTRVAGGAFAEKIVSNQGGAGATGAERLIQSDFFPGIRDYKVDADLDWLNAVTAGDGRGLCVRLTDDGLTGYIAILYS